MVCFHSKSTYVDDAWGKCKSLFTKDKQAGLIPTCPKDYVYIYAFISQMLFKKILFRPEFSVLYDLASQHMG